MKQTNIIMGMPVTVEIVDRRATAKDLALAFDYFNCVDEKFSTYKEQSEISRFNRGEVSAADVSEDMKTIFALSEETKKMTDGYFDIQTPTGICDPSGIVKGWAIYNAAQLLAKNGFENFYVDAGGDVQTKGTNADGTKWRVGIRHPFNQDEVVKVLYIEDKGVATSGTYIRGQHIYNPKEKNPLITDIVCFTVVGPNVYEADRFATAAFAMGKKGIAFIEKLEGFEAYMIDCNGLATMTNGFENYCRES